MPPDVLEQHFLIHLCADTYVRAAATTAGCVAKLWDDQKYAKNNRSGSAVYTLVPLSHKYYGRLGQPARRYLNELANPDSSTRAVDTLRFINSALQEIYVSLCRGNHCVVVACRHA